MNYDTERDVWRPAYDDFIEPGNPYSLNSRRDLDMVGFAVVKVYPTGHELAYDRYGPLRTQSRVPHRARRFA